jgi:hypothetical protein
VLGRDCIAAGFYPPGTNNELQEVQRLQRHLGG